MTTISELAAQWAVRGASGTLSHDEQRELDAWLAADPRHRGAYVRARAQWIDLDRLAALNGPAQEIADAAPISHSRRNWLIAAGVACVTTLAGGVAWLSTGDKSDRFATVVGEVRRIPLHDGSTLVLNTDTEVLVQLSETRRDLYLRRGEALFEVAHDAARPFIVHANDAEVRAVGTAFTVRLASEQIDVTVTEGIVELTQPPQLTSNGAPPESSVRPMVQRVKANERAVIAMTRVPEVVSIAKPELTRQLAWREGMVSFDGESLSVAVGEINRHNRRQIVIADAELAARPVVGVFRATDVDGFAAAAATTLNARATVGDDVIRLESNPAP